MNRVRGKSLLWIVLLAFILSATMVNVGYSQPPKPIVYVDPPSQSVTDYDTAAPPQFTYNIMILDVLDLYAWGLRLSWDFEVLSVDTRDVLEGEFLKRPPNRPDEPYTDFTKILNLVDRFLDMGCTKLGDIPGVSGSGTLATVTFTVRDAGTTPLHLFDVELLDSNLHPIEYDLIDGEFASLTSSPFEAELVMKRLDDHYFLYPSMGTSQWFYSKVKNTIGPYPLFVKTHFSIVREDGKAFTLITATSRLDSNDIVDLNFEFMLAKGLKGRWSAVATAYYSYGGAKWIASEKVKTFSYVIALD